MTLTKVVVCVLVVSTGCAVRTHRVEDVTESSKAHALLAEGCFHCLQTALAIFEGIAARPQPTAAAQLDVVRAALLVAIRARELGLAEDAALAEARLSSASRRIANHSVEGSRAALYIGALPLVQGEMSGLSPEQRDRRADTLRALWPTDGTMPSARRELSPLVPSDLTAQYLALTIDCEDVRVRKRLNANEVLARFPVPLIRFRLARCGDRPEDLAALRHTNGQWVDTYFFEGRREMARLPKPSLQRADESFQRAHNAFPGSPAVTMALATTRNALGNHEQALRLFDAMLEAEPTHRDAHLGRLLSLSYLSRHAEAISTATHLIDLGMHHRGDAFYWRAWNRYRLYQLAEAWDDVREASALLDNTSVHTLAGYIAYARQWVETAIDRLGRAYALDHNNCEAVWTEALVHVDKKDWSAAALRFSTSVACFTAADEQLTRDLTTSDEQRPDESATSHALQQKESHRIKHRLAQAAYNAAWTYARIGDRAVALRFSDVAARDPLLREKAMALKASLRPHF